MNQTLRVLIVEDNPDDCELVLRALGTGGYVVKYVRVQTAEAMRAALLENSWDLVISDYALPTFSAPEALKVLKESAVDIPFIIVSGTVGEDVAVEALKSGAHDFMSKGRLTRLCPAVDRELRELDARRSRKQAEQAQRTSEARFRAIMEAATDAVIAADGSGNITYVNPAAEKMFGYTGEELVGRRFRELIVERDEKSQAGERSRPGVPAARSGEILGKRRDGSEFPADLALSSWIAGDEHHVAGIVRDITDRKHVESQLLVADRMVAVGILAAGIAHEINNPLSAVIANLDLILQEYDAGKSNPQPVGPVQDELRDAREAAYRVRHIVRDLKIFSRGDDEQRGPVDVRRVMESTLRMAWNEIRHRARVVKNYGNVPAVEASEARLGQVFLNLLINAAQAIPEGNVEGNTIRVSSWLDGARVCIEISDTGPGIPPKVMQRLFTPFITTKPVGVGTGLGLSICHRIVTSLGGEIRVALPCAAGRVPDSPVHGIPVAPSVRRGRVMVVDDEAPITRAIRRALVGEHDVVILQRASAALDLIVKGQAFDVIFCDLMMPEMTGMDFHKELVRVAPEQAARVIFLTGGAFTSTARAFLDGVPNQSIEKPFEVRQLRAIVNDRVR